MNIKLLTFLIALYDGRIYTMDVDHLDCTLYTGFLLAHDHW